MAYQPTDWRNREVERPRTFEMQNNPDGTTTLIPSEGVVTEPGTPIMASNMNKIEDQLVVMEHHAANHLPGGIDPIPLNALTNVDKIVYVSSTGDDNNDGSQFSPFKTVSKALSSMNKVQTGKREILLQDAGPFSIPPITGFVGGELLITGIAGLSLLDLVNSGPFQAAEIRNCSCYVSITNFNIISDSGEASFVITNIGGSVLLKGISSIVAGGLPNYRTFARTENARVEISSCEISNHNSILNGQKGSFVICFGNSGTGNELGYRSNMAIVIRDNSISAATMELKHAGGQIFS